MGDLSTNFSRSEFACKDNCGFDTVDADLLVVLEAVRDRFGVPVKIESGCRCSAHNKKIRGSERSQHMLGRAADIVVQGVPSWKVQDFIDNTWPDRYGLGRYKGFTHIDTRNGKARWEI